MHISNQIHAFNYIGSKFSLLPWLRPKMKRTLSWVEVFGGSMAQTLNQEPYSIETYNDLNGNVVNFFNQLRKHPQELIDQLFLTPHSRLEFENAWDCEGDSDLERARKFFVRVRQSFLATGAQNELKGWSTATKQSRCNISEATSKYLNSIDGLMDVAERIRRIQIECRPFEFILKSYDAPTTMFYCDPPYDVEKRSSSSDYEFDFKIEDHIRLHDMAKDVEGFIAISGYNTDFMKDLYKDFKFTLGPHRKNNLSSKRNVHECLWTNYDVFNCNNPHTLFENADNLLIGN